MNSHSGGLFCIRPILKILIHFQTGNLWCQYCQPCVFTKKLNCTARDVESVIDCCCYCYCCIYCVDFFHSHMLLQMCHHCKVSNLIAFDFCVFRTVSFIEVYLNCAQKGPFHPCVKNGRCEVLRLCNGCSAWRALGTAKTVTRVP